MKECGIAAGHHHLLLGTGTGKGEQSLSVPPLNCKDNDDKVKNYAQLVLLAWKPDEEQSKSMIQKSATLATVTHMHV